MYASFFSSTSQRLAALKKTRVDFAVRVLLGQALEKLRINPHTTYLTTASEENLSSVTLFDETLACVEKQSCPTYTQGTNEIFNKRYSFAPEDRVKALDLIAFEKIVLGIVSSLVEKPAMDLSWPGLKSVTPKDMEAVLKTYLPGLDLNDIHVTGFATDERGGRTIASSQTLADHLLGHFGNNDIPYHAEGDHQAVNLVPFSSEEMHRHPLLTAGHLNDLLIKILPRFLV
ncbi:hypothetical protein OC610_12330 [Pseudomonas sp. SAICEU22]|uniref:Uncharacterized protein n=1 Tax=Pseudomonas agronomica TaxID=2979328 RepID=A0ABT3F9L3_9PSED|nr:hypothetical protein [Pseudomonas agronomica]MCW1245195.1 hypothetical protein [Pseudomonas agronomica]